MRRWIGEGIICRSGWVLSFFFFFFGCEHMLSRVSALMGLQGFLGGFFVRCNYFDDTTSLRQSHFSFVDVEVANAF